MIRVMTEIIRVNKMKTKTKREKRKKKKKKEKEKEKNAAIRDRLLEQRLVLFRKLSRTFGTASNGGEPDHSHHEVLCGPPCWHASLI